jgi:ubiquinone/menaquinone biosynthesis C-methylase UbiE
MASSSPSRNPDPANSATSGMAICDYEGSAYRTDFWTQDRTYEDAVERIALGAMLPPTGRRLIEIGVGFGRLVDLYAGYDQVVFFDYSRSMLQQARAQWGEASPTGRPRYTYVAGDFYALPFVAGLFDAVTMIRVIHHAQDAPQVLRGVSEILTPGGAFVLEFANKRNLKAIARWSLQRQAWNPFDPAPYEFAELNFDFHPRWMESQLKQAGFTIRDRRSVSHFRVGALKRLIPTRYLVKLDRLIQPTGRWWQLTPSLFVKSRVTHAKPAAEENSFFRCPVCHSSDLLEQSDVLVCKSCQNSWLIHGGLYDFKKPI